VSRSVRTRNQNNMDSSSESDYEEEEQRLFIVGCYTVHIGDRWNNFHNSTGASYVLGVFPSRKDAEVASQAEKKRTVTGGHIRTSIHEIQLGVPCHFYPGTD
jgi:hypothetical protein